MAPVQLQAHICAICRKMVIDLNHLRFLRQDECDQTEHRALFDLTLEELISGEGTRCSLCSWILNNKCIPAESITTEARELNIVDDEHRREFEYALDVGLITGLVEIGHSKETTFRALASSSDSIFLNYQVFARTSGIGLDILASLLDDVTSEFISTRPINEDPGANENLGKIASWLQTCQNSHSNCKSKSDILPGRVIEIIEISANINLRLREAKDIGSLSFAALSYCWGGEKSLKCLRSNITDLMTTIPLESLPSTILDFVKLCHYVKMKYIWIDALCIIQDDSNDTTIETAKMSRIYRSATFTLSAARAKSVHDGFLQKRNISAQKESFILPCKLQDGRVGSVTFIDLDLSEEPLDERGWTLQEWLLSPRMIEFGARQTRCICQELDSKSSFVDGWRKEPELTMLEKNSLKLMEPEYASIEKRVVYRIWNSLVPNFTSRKLSISLDRVVAIAGLAETFAQILDDKYIAGIWKSGLLSSLLWQAPLLKYATVASDKKAPSWSWMSINGPVCFSDKLFEPEEGELNNYTAKIIDIKIDFISSLAPYGAIHPESGRLTHRARICIGVWGRVPFCSIIERDSETLIYCGRNDFRFCMIEGTLFRDLKKRGPVMGIGQSSYGNFEVKVVELPNKETKDTWVCSGLVLYNDTEHMPLYKRLGTFHSIRQGVKRGTESDEEWKRFIDTKYNYFKNVEYHVIEIM